MCTPCCVRSACARNCLRACPRSRRRRRRPWPQSDSRDQVMNFQDRQSQGSVAPPPRQLTPEQRRKVLIITASAVGAVLAILVGWNLFTGFMMKKFFANNKPPPMAVSTEVVQTATIDQSLTAIGSVAAVHQVVISSE